MEYLFAIIFGLLIGSFLNVCIYRIPEGESIAFPPSHCSSCEHRLGPLDLIPVLSYLFLRGRCRYCGERISPRYPLVELLNMGAYLLVYKAYGFSLETLIYAGLISILIVIFFIDYDHKIIPNKLNISIVVLYIIYLIVSLGLSMDIHLTDSLMGLVIGGGFYLLIALITAGAMGGGDIKLMGALGLFLGVQNTIVALFLTFIIGGVFSVGLLIFKKAKRKSEIPFGPFIVIGSTIGLLYGSDIVRIYINTII